MKEHQPEKKDEVGQENVPLPMRQPITLPLDKDPTQKSETKVIIYIVVV